MEKFKKILAFGDSHVAGCELSNIHSLDEYLKGNITLEQADASGKSFAFPQLLANSLNIPCENYALTGGSNERSLRKLAETVEENCLILFGYTSPDRKEFYYPDEGLYLGRDNDGFIQAGMQWTGSINKQVSNTRMSHPFNDVFINNILRPYDNTEMIIKYVDALCQANDCKVFHLMMWETDFEKKAFDFEGKRNYITWCKTRNFERMPFLHYGHNAHQALAQLIEEKIK